MITLLFETGMRISELLNLKFGSIKCDFGDYILEFEQKGGAIHPHTTRVSFIRQSHKEGMDIYSIRKIVGHSSVRTNER